MRTALTKVKERAEKGFRPDAAVARTEFYLSQIIEENDMGSVEAEGLVTKARSVLSRFLPIRSLGWSTGRGRTYFVRSFAAYFWGHFHRNFSFKVHLVIILAQGRLIKQIEKHSLARSESNRVLARFLIELLVKICSCVGQYEARSSLRLQSLD
jgi:hypothetical protein